MLRLRHRLKLSLLIGITTAAAAAQDHSPNQSPSPTQSQVNCSVDRTPPSEADRALQQRDFPHAEQIYTAALKERPDNPTAIAGLIRARLGEGRLDEALTLARKSVADYPKSALLEDALGEVAMRRGEPEQAVAAFEAAVHIDPCLARVHFEIYRYLTLAAMDRSARKQLEQAHALAPTDIAIASAWDAATAVPLTSEQNIARLNQRINAPDATPEQKAGAAEAIRAIESRQRGDCQPTADIPSTTLTMAEISDGPSRPHLGVGLDVLLNGKHKRLLIDTGASGLMISRGSALSAGLVPEAEIKTSGIGDAGPTGSFVTHVDDLKIGNMEFHNCIVRVFEKRSALSVDGLIGADVFKNYLVTLDTPARELRLAPLPRRPDEAVKTEALATTGENTEGEPVPAPKDLLQDRYIAPEMKDWTRIYRLGHQLILPTRIGDAPTKLFIMDTGASIPLISTQAAREVTHVDINDRLHVRGVSGAVKNVSQADAVTLQFAGVRQRVEGMVSIDTSGISRSLGLEIAGFIAFPTLSDLIIAIDYRDDLIHVVYDPKHGYHTH